MNKILVVFGALFIAFAMVINPIIQYNSVESLSLTPTKLERQCSGGKDNECFYTVWTKGEVFRNSDTFLFFKFNSTDVQNKFEVGKTYDVKVSGWRVPFFSWYRNIIEVR